MPDYCIDEVSDHVIAMLHTWNRKIATFDKSVKDKGWEHLGLNMRIMRLRNKNIGIVGFGRIGQAVAEKSKVFGLNIMVSDPVVSQSFAADKGCKLVDMDELLTESDFVTLHAPLMESTINLIGKRELSLMKKDSFLINAARGQLINEKDLLEALKANTIGGAGLDVMADNHPPIDHPFFSLENILITPHIAFSPRNPLLS